MYHSHSNLTTLILQGLSYYLFQATSAVNKEGLEVLFKNKAFQMPFLFTINQEQLFVGLLALLVKFAATERKVICINYRALSTVLVVVPE